MTAFDRAAAWAAQQWQKWPTIPRLTEEQRYRKRWSQTLIDRGKHAGKIPLFGSREWCELEDDDPRKAASAIRAAEAWAHEGDDLGFTILAEAYDRRRADDEHWKQVHAGRDAIVAHTLDRQDIVEAREQARHQQSTDYQGGPVDFWTGEPPTERGTDGLHDRRAAHAPA